jgi:hypothetical protein
MVVTALDSKVHCREGCATREEGEVDGMIREQVSMLEGCRSVATPSRQHRTGTFA